MEENENIGEQPLETVQPVATDGDLGTNASGSPLGKFKNTDALLGAYNELQSEFTRKCQKLSEVEKELNEQKSITPENSDNCSEKPLFAFDEKISDFLDKHKSASEMLDEMANEIINDDNLQNDENGLDKAFARVLEKKYVPEDKLVQSDEFLEKYVYSNDKIKDKIIKDYITSLCTTQSPITVNNSGFSRTIATENKFNSLEDARSYVENMFKF